jgi:hypothetical protein
MGKLGFEYNYETNSIKINRLNPLIWLVFLLDLVFGPLVMLFCKRYTVKEWLHELKCIIKGSYERL